MSRMLSFLDFAWITAQELATLKRPHDAIRMLKQMIDQPLLPSDIAMQARRMLGQLLLDQQSYREARKHLRIAAEQNPECASVRFELGLAFESDSQGCDYRAARHFAKASELEPENRLYSAHLARAAARIGKRRLAREAVRKSLADPRPANDILAVLTEALCLLGKPSVALKMLAKARFLAPHDRLLKRLWQEARYEQLAQDQLDRQPETEATVLLFPGVEASTRPVLPFRRDRASEPRPHFTFRKRF